MRLIDNTKKFDGLATEYSKGRPAYAKKFIDELYEKYGFSKESIVADVGAGTGKFAKQILDKGSFVYCVEPNVDMRTKAVGELKAYKNVECIDGDAANTCLNDNSVDFVTVAQAFHWFEVESFKRECKRILKPGGKVFLVWNSRDTNFEIVCKNAEIYNRYCPGFKGFSNGIQENDARIEEFFDGKYEKVKYDNPLYFTKEIFISRCLSSSYSLKCGEDKYNEYVGELEKLFDVYEVNGTVCMPNSTIVYFGRVDLIK